MSALSIIFNPTFWKYVSSFPRTYSYGVLTIAFQHCCAQWYGRFLHSWEEKNEATSILTCFPPAEYSNKTLTRIFSNNPRRACYFLAAVIFSLGLVRDFIFERALRAQPHVRLFENPYQAIFLIGVGNVLVLTSYYRLGITGTFLGDYFGILMDDMVTGFPFSVTEAPMYWGSTCSFLGSSLLYGRPAGLLLTLVVWAAYKVALQFENPFTSEIYAKRERERKAGSEKAR